ncbi:hypothetical protein LCGC14_1786540, partial [marine sediment metagenome]
HQGMAMISWTRVRRSAYSDALTLPDSFLAAPSLLAALLADGKLTYATDIKVGIEAAPAAISDLYAGKNTGKSLIYIG